MRLYATFKTVHILHNLLENPMDKVEHFGKSGIYELKCKDCDAKYIGQSRTFPRARSLHKILVEQKNLLWRIMFYKTSFRLIHFHKN